MSLSPDLTVTPTPDVRNPLLALAPGTWRETQDFDFCPIVSPWDSTLILIFMSGMASPVASGAESIGLLTAPVSDPGDITLVGQMMTALGSGWESGGQGLRAGSVLYDVASDRLRLYYSVDNATTSCGMVEIDRFYNFTRYSGNPMLTPTGQGRVDGDHVSQPAVIKAASTYYKFYSYRNGSAILPGIRYATSTDGLNWAKAGSGDVYSLGGLYCEFHQVTQLPDGTFLALQEAGDTSHSFQIYAFTAPSPAGPWTLIANPWLGPSRTVGAWDRWHVATAALLTLPTRIVLYACAAGDLDQIYWNNTWRMGMWNVRAISSGGGGGGTGQFGTVFAGVVRGS